MREHQEIIGKIIIAIAIIIAGIIISKAIENAGLNIGAMTANSIENLRVGS